MIWLDILIIGVLVLFALLGLIKGFMRSFLSLFSSVVTLILAIWLAKPFSNLLESWFGMTSALENSIEPTFENFFSSGDYTTGWIAQLLNIIMGSEYMAQDPSADVLATDFSHNVGTIMAVVICAIILYVLIRIGLWLLSKLAKKITEGRGISVLDRILGVVIGLAKAFVYIFVCLGIIFVLGSFIPSMGAWIDNMMGQNAIASVFYGWVQSFMQNTLLPFILGS